MNGIDLEHSPAKIAKQSFPKINNDINTKEDQEFSMDTNDTEEYSLDLEEKDDENDDERDDEKEDKDEDVCILQRQDTEPVGNVYVSITVKQNKSLKSHKTVSEFETKVEDLPKPKLDKSIQSVMEDVNFIKSIFVDIDIEKVYQKLNELRKQPNRVDIVTNEILENMDKFKKQEKKIQVVKEGSAASVIEDFVKVIDKVMANISSLPISAEEIRALLQGESGHSDRVDRVVAKLLKLHYKGLK